MITNGTILRGEGLSKSYGRPPARNEVLHGAALSVRRGEFVAVMGPSGCGKSTLLHILGLMSRPDTGRLEIEGRDVLAASESDRTRMRRRVVGFVFQRFNLLSSVSARDNIAISLRIRGLKADRAEILAWLDRMGVAHVAKRKCTRMSVGEHQRVAVAVALAHRPSILLADEPTGSLDSANAESLLGLFRSVNASGQTIVMITHSPAAAECADRILYMKDGRIEGSSI
ncbi:MAG: ABC transporter ATP-binding protein [Planctomycetes bacterium]|nr:ABC transporter ATP-binding protein [Planctomycetota bacterium]